MLQPHRPTIFTTFALVIALTGCLGLTGCQQQAVSQAAEEQVAQEDKSSPSSQEEKKGEPSGNKDPEEAKEDTPPVKKEAETKDENAKPDEKEEKKDENPFARRIPVPDFPKDMSWINTSGPLRKADLKGKFVIMDFWTYCCINCLHILPELKKLEKAYPNELVVIGVHSAKFDTEKDTKNISEAVLRYEIEHPVVNDFEHKIWNTFGVNSWPTMLLIDPEGNAIWGTTGEVKFEEVDRILKLGIPYYREKKLLDETPLRFDLLSHRVKKTPLRFPGKVMADEKGNRLFITDSNHNRLVVTDLDGKLLYTIGSGTIGQEDGDFATATFDHPQGVALNGETLYVADTENHLLRKIDLEKKTVATIAGIGKQGRIAWPGLDKLGPTDKLPERWVGKPKETGINSPWALWIHKDKLYIAMAGPHQIWMMPLDESEIGPYAGNGREDIVDGPLIPQRPYEEGYSSFAQPSGLTSDGTWLYVADSEGSSIRAVPFDPKEKVRTVVGSADQPYGRLFDFGDIDGEKEKARLQHALGVTYHDGNIYTTDTYNNKVKVVDAKTGAVRTLAGTSKPGASDADGTFDEPTGISYAKGKLYVADTNNHAIRLVDPKSGKVETLEIVGLTAPVAKKTPKKPTFPGATQVKLKTTSLKSVDGVVKLSVNLKLPFGWKVNAEAPMGYFVDAVGDTGAVDRTKLAKLMTKLKKPTTTFEISLPVSGDGDDEVKVSMVYYYCQEGNEGLCKIGSVTWIVPLKIAGDASSDTVKLDHTAK